MPVTQAELDSFHRFASQRIQADETCSSWDELFVLWDSQRHRDGVNAAIREGIADVDAGRYEPADAAMEDIRTEFGFPE